MPVLISVVLDRLQIPPFVLIDLAFSSGRSQVWLFSTPCFLCWTRQTVFHQGICLSNSVISILLVVCGDCCREISVVLLSYRIKRLEDSWSKSFFRGSFLNTPTKCKCLRGYKLFFESIFVVDLTRDLASTILSFHCSS
jgi:hypothetical protein